MVLTPSELAEYQEYVQLALVHKYTRHPATPGTVDKWKMEPPTYPTSTADVACNYLAEGVLSTREEGVHEVSTPSIMIAKTDTLKIGDKVTNIKDSDNVVVHAGPLYVESIVPAMGFGPVTNYIAELSGTAPKKW